MSKETKVLKDLLYTKSHEWVKVNDGVATIGITDFAQDELGDIVYVELPEVGDEFDAGDEFGTVESVKSVSEILTPFAGTVVTVNDLIDDEPELVNDDPMGEGWFIEVEVEEDIDTSELMNKEEYEAYIAE